MHDSWHFIKGYGFSSSFLYTQKFFPNSKYGNFHSELITIFFETGVIGFILYFLFLSIPLITLLMQQLRKNINYILIGISFFLQGIFYQQFLFQYYWIMIAIIWLVPVIKFPGESSLKNVA
ncbi:hypothetical protein AHMF7616_01574 [Adhaeribacter pallidiroseus]|uniref:Uncharacterized protein n=1 Tax=Adhaeribacter pallidiroseus TaxID=2072847 RepID=A0A369QHC6_9BACT|nr:hypothetical protein AHMF7616_01574 [Adhaeribacter pallidiroseus]